MASDHRDALQVQIAGRSTLRDLCESGNAGKYLENRRRQSILIVMAVNWLELAKKMAQAARAGVAFERRRLQEILAEGERKPS